MIYFLSSVVFTLALLLYFRLADRYNIIDKPNQRSSHSIPTIRGGGVVFVVAILFWFVSSGFLYPWFVLGFLCIAIISFIDDLREQTPLRRFSIQLIAFVLMGIELSIWTQPVILILIMAIVGIGAINAFNFMDGINGITGIYALINFITLWAINTYVIEFTKDSLIILTIISVVIFLYFNFRKKARCFAGDIGSVTLAFIQLFLIIQLILTSGNYGWILMFLIFGVDSVVTIIYRLRRGENIFKSHRSHLYQYLSNELGYPQLIVSVGYGFAQLMINILLVLFLMSSLWWFALLMLLIPALIYVIIREIVLRKVGHLSFFSNTKIVNR